MKLRMVLIRWKKIISTHEYAEYDDDINYLA